MEYETGKFKRDTTNRNGKPTNTIRVTGLSVNSIFKDNEDLIIMSKTEFTKFENQVNNSTKIIKDLKNQLQKANTKVETLQNAKQEPLPENPKYTNKIIELQDEKTTLLNTINNRNGLLLGTQDKFNEMLDDITTAFSTEITKANEDIVSQLKAKTDILKENITVLIDYVKELETLQEIHNNKVDNSSWYKRAFSKDTFKLEIDTGKLNDLDNKLNDINQYCINYESIVKPIEIPASRITEIKLNAKSNKFDIKELYIDTGNLDDQEENIVITPEANDNGNDG